MNEPTLKIPWSQDAEEALLGALLLEQDLMIEVSTIIEPLDFYRPQNQAIYKLMLKLWGDGIPFDIVTIAESAKKSDIIDKVGGLVYLDQLFDSVPASENAKNYAAIIRDDSQRRRLISICQKGLSGASEAENFQDILNETSQGIIDINLDVTKEISRPFKDVIPEYKQNLRYAVENPKARQIFYPTGLPGVDKIMDGFAPKMFDILAARPNIGKTALALQLAVNVALQGHPVVFVSIEMWESSIINRIIANMLKIDSRKLMWSDLSESQVAEVENLDIENLPFVIEDKIYTLQQIWNRCRYWQHHFGGLGLVVVDFMQRIYGGGQIFERTTEASRSLAQMAKQLNCAVLGISQINRAGDAQPKMKDLEGSGALEQDGNRVLIMHRERDNRDVYCEKIKLIVEKNKHAVAGASVMLDYHTRYNRFVESGAMNGVSRISQQAPSKLTLPPDEDEFRGDL